MLSRFLSDLRDLWTLITKGHPEVDALLPWRIAADLAKHQPTPVDWHKWEAGQYSVNRLAFWFDPDRYAGTAYDWPHDHKVKAIAAYRDHMVVTRGRVDDPRFDVQEPEGYDQYLAEMEMVKADFYFRNTYSSAQLPAHRYNARITS